MERDNSLGIPRDQLSYALRTRRLVANAIQTDSCLLCCRHQVNEAGLCRFCYGSLNGEELKLAVRWNSGVGP